MVSFTKLHQAVIHSSIWSEPDHVRIVWITMLAMANSDGMVEASIGGLARAANVSRDRCEEALAVLMGPDPDSRDGTTGERVQQVPGGFFIINYADYRDVQTPQQVQAAKRARAYRDKKRASRTITQHSGPQPAVTTEEEAEEEEDKKKSAEQSAAKPRRARAVARPDDVPVEVWDDFRSLRKTKKAPLTPTAWDTIQAEAKKARWTVERALRECVSRGWAGFRADWVLGKGSKDAGASHAVPQTRHNSELELGDPKCDCLSCKALRRDRRAS